MRRRWVAVGDTHGDLISKDDERVFLDFCKDFKPHTKVHLGDGWDFRNLRRGVDPEEELDDPEPDFLAGLSFIERYRPTVFLCGNHDHRLWRMAGDTRGIVRKYARDGIKQIEAALKAIRCEFLPYDIELGEYRLGSASFIHGYSCGTAAVKQHVFSYGRSIVMGHLHRNEIMAAPCKGGLFGMSVGGLGNHSAMSYSRQRHATLAWGSGWAYGYYDDRTGKTDVLPMFKQGTKWLTTIG